MKFNSLHSLFTKSTSIIYQKPPEREDLAMYELHHEGFTILNNTKIAGYRASDIKTVDSIYNLIHTGDVDAVFDYTVRAITFVNEQCAPVVGSTQNKVIFRVKGKRGRLFTYLRHSVVNGVANGKIYSNYTFLQDISWMRPRPLTWQLSGPGTEFFDFGFNKVDLLSASLSKREAQILEMLSRGFQSSDISRALQISIHTVYTHRRNMLAKLEAANTPELLMNARELNLLV